ncbi:hypothetical protein [Auraticoccus monumenti]|uniref:Lipase (Class 3) n=1 Tax=Auraticoccus monumenti TaxID=675864 RepID=A0A1G6VQL3_9ACTN|nr:hypothetical protein [Auraticoccus monumenti]SDD55950.1 hypothetical protein SAMN04489747_1231 [Auraticoccus monumenti]
MPAAVPVVTQADIAAATALLTPESQGFGEALLDGIEGAYDVLESLPDLPGVFLTAIVDRIVPGESVIEALTGDAGAIRAHADQLRRVAERVRAQATTVDDATGGLGGWEGLAAEACRATLSTSAECVLAAAASIDAVAAAHLDLGGRVAVARAEVIELVREMVGRMGREALSAIATAGLAIVGGVLTIAGAAAGGAVDGFIDGVGDAFSGGGVGAIWDGTAEGFQRGLDEGLRRAMEMWLAAVGAIVSGYLRDIDDFVDDAIEPMTELIGTMTGLANRMDRASSLLTTGTDPGDAADAPSQGQGLDAQGTTPQTGLDADLIGINGVVGSDDEIPGYPRATDEELAALGLDGMGFVDGRLTDDNGVVVEVFMGPDGPVVAFGGTTVGPGGAGPDVVEDAVGAGTLSPQTEQALAVAEAINASPGGDDVVYTGHSLGGRLASIASLASGNAAITYNAAGVSDATVDYIARANGTTSEALLQQASDGQVRAYRTGDDILTRAQEGIPGSQHVHDAVGAPIEYGDGTLQSDGIGGHQLDNVEESYEEDYGVQVPDAEGVV